LITDPSHPSQFYQLLVSGVLLTTILLIIKSRAKQIGAVTYSFLIGYGLSRFLMEYFRQPDPQRAGRFFEWLSMGQILSLVLILVGVLIFLSQRKKSKMLH